MRHHLRKIYKVISNANNYFTTLSLCLCFILIIKHTLHGICYCVFDYNKNIADMTICGSDLTPMWKCGADMSPLGLCS